jgi:dipeptidyl aminopeptidase/acylaminoacyl peptidase
VPVAGGKPRRLTPWGNGRFESPSSFSPNGRLLALDRAHLHGPEAVALDLVSHRTRLIASEAEDPVYSPDGSKVALVSYRDHITSGEGEDRTGVGELYVVTPGGQHPVRLTHDRDRQEANPSWDPSSQRIAYVQGTAQWAVGLTGVVMEVNADGSCPTTVLGTPRKEGKYGPPLNGPGFYAPAWQPGVGREAGAISC